MSGLLPESNPSLKLLDDQIRQAKHFLKNLLRSEKSDVSGVIVYGIGASLFALAVPIAAQNIVNAVMLGPVLQPLVVLTIAVFLLLLVSGGLKVLQAISVEIIQRRLFSKVALHLSTSLPKLDSKSLDESDGAELTNRFFEVMSVQKAASIILLDGVTLVLQITVSLILLAVYHPVFVLFDVFILFFLWMIVSLPSQDAIRTSILESKSKYAVMAWLEEIVKNPILSKNPQARDFSFKTVDSLTYSYLKKRKSHFRILLQQVIGIVSLQAVASAALLGIGGYLVMNGQLTLGQLVAAEIALTLSLSAASKLTKVLEAYYDLLASTDKLNQLVNLKIEESDGEGLISTEVGMEVEFRSVLTLNTTATHSPRPISFTIHPGERVALMGVNGSGKSAGLRAETSRILWRCCGGSGF